jgi:ABC-type transport system substrate-binding protein
MASDAGFRSTQHIADYATEYMARYRSSRGRFAGWLTTSSIGFAFDAITSLRNEFHSRGGDSFYGFSSYGRSDGAGDSYVDAQLDKALVELDRGKRNAIAAELQRYLAKKQYNVKMPGGSSGFRLAWPVLGNFAVYRRGLYSGRPEPFFWWIDDTQPPLSRA